MIALFLYSQQLSRRVHLSPCPGNTSLFDNGHLNRCKMISHFTWFWFSFSWLLLMWSTFSSTCWPFVSWPFLFFRKTSTHVPWPFLIGNFLFAVELYEVLIYFEYELLSEIWLVNIPSHFIGIFSCSWLFLLLYKSFLVWGSPSCLFLLMLAMLLVCVSKKTLLRQIMSRKFFSSLQF